MAVVPSTRAARCASSTSRLRHRQAARARARAPLRAHARACARQSATASRTSSSARSMRRARSSRSRLRRRAAVDLDELPGFAADAPFVRSSSASSSSRPRASRRTASTGCTIRCTARFICVKHDAERIDQERHVVGRRPSTTVCARRPAVARRRRRCRRAPAAAALAHAAEARWASAAAARSSLRCRAGLLRRRRGRTGARNLRRQRVGALAQAARSRRDYLLDERERAAGILPIAWSEVTLVRSGARIIHADVELSRVAGPSSHGAPSRRARGGRALAVASG